MTAWFAQIPKLIVRVRFSSPRHRASRAPAAHRATRPGSRRHRPAARTGRQPATAHPPRCRQHDEPDQEDM